MNLHNKKIHMIGIGGVGMSGLAYVLARMGCAVSGSDIEENVITKRLRRKGVIVHIGHSASRLHAPEVIVYSSSIRADNSELVEARFKKIPVISRIELLRMVMEKYRKTIGVLGTHGKTTTTAMVSLLTEYAGMDPTVLIGGDSPHFRGNAKIGKSKMLVTEIDESDGRFVCLRPTHILMPNLEREHAEFYRDEAHLVNVFKRFISAQPERSAFFYRIEDANLRKLAKVSKGKVFSFGFSKEADLYAAGIKIEAYKTGFDCFSRGRKIGRFILRIPGIHNVIDGLAALSLGVELGIDSGTMKRAMAAYKNVRRRFEVIGDLNGAKVVEDYAHHPTEIRATITAAYSTKPKRIITVFQPHRYTRTKVFFKEFSNSFAGSDEVILTEVYAASEERLRGAGAKRIYDAMRRTSHIPVKLLGKNEIPGYLSKKTKKGDLILVLGAGDIGKTAHELVSGVKK
ncbi:MAG: UDP-N-acetylmuramate--L-alanine ligase [Omnitrophica bacterium]|nr:UDP-N-acetylmuramate--L-alanine ligase [Candidatus Omnitrophota bacterium]